MVDEGPKDAFRALIPPNADPRVTAFAEEIWRRVGETPGLLRSPLGTTRVKLPRIRRKVEHMVPVAITFAVNHPRVMPVGDTEEELKTALQNLANLNHLRSALANSHTIVKDSIHKLETDLWKAALRIYRLARAHEGTDPAAAQFSQEMRAKMKLGPRMQTYVMAKIPPTRLSKKALKKAQLAKARQDAGLPPQPE